MSETSSLLLSDYARRSAPVLAAGIAVGTCFGIWLSTLKLSDAESNHDETTDMRTVHSRPTELDRSTGFATERTTAPSKSSQPKALDIEDMIARMPKVELHVHLDGAFDELAVFAEAKALQDAGLTAEVLPEQVTLFGETFPVRKAVETCATGSDFKRLASCKGKRSLHAMFRCFEVFLPVVRGRLSLIEELAFRFVERQAAQSVVYTEVRYSPQLLADGGLLVQQSPNEEEDAASVPIPRSEHASSPNQQWPLRRQVSAEDVYEAVTRGLRRGEAKFGVKVNQIFCLLAFRPDWAADVVRLAAKYRASSPCAVVGVDVAGGEEWIAKPPAPVGKGGDNDQEDESTSDLHTRCADALTEARKIGLNITLHAGEDTGAANVGAAIFDHGASRIGHGYHLIDDPNLLASAIARGVHFECCPTSSFETGGWSGQASDAMNWSQHPMVNLLKAGASVGVNSDDPAVFATSLRDELVLCATTPVTNGIKHNKPGLNHSSTTGKSLSLEQKNATTAKGAAVPSAPTAAAFPEGGMGLKLSDLHRMTMMAAEAAFLPPNEKAALRKSLEESFRRADLA